jgi:hypothetical protein
VGEFQSITKRAAGSNDGIAEAKRADGHAQVNISRGTPAVGSCWGTHCVRKDSMKPSAALKISSAGSCG